MNSAARAVNHVRVVELSLHSALRRRRRRRKVLRAGTPSVSSPCGRPRDDNPTPPPTGSLLPVITAELR